MVISIMDILLYAKVSPFIIREWLCCCLQVNYIVFTHFDRSLYIWVSDPTCVQNFRPLPLMVFEIQGLKLNKKKKKKKKEQKKNWRIGLFATSPMLVVQFSPYFRYTYILTLAITLWFQKWIITESESVNLNFPMYRHNGQRPRPSLYTKYYRTL